MFTLRSGYTEADFARAVEGLGLEWDYLTWIALGVAQDALADAAGTAVEAVANGAETFMAGLLIGLHLPERRDAPVDLGLQLPWAVDEVLERGRGTVIAEHCNPETVAVLEEIHASALAQSLQLPERQLAGLKGAFQGLLESGLAVGLVLTREL